MILTKEFRFEASHQLPWHKGKCARLHGHSWKLTVAVEALKLPDDPSLPHPGMVMDYADIKAVVQKIVDALDHHHLGYGEVVLTHKETGFDEPFLLPATVSWFDVINPTSENLLIWIANQLPLEFPWVQLELNETCTTACVLTREDWETFYATTQEAKDQASEEAPGRRQRTEDAESQTPQEVSDDDIPF